MPTQRSPAVPTPEPLVARHVKMNMHFETPKRFVHPFHCIGLRISGSGHYVCGSERMPDETPYVCFIPMGDDDICGLVGPVEGWWASFQWPGTRIRREGSHLLNLAWAGRKLRIPRWKTLDAEALTRMLELFRTLRQALGRPEAAGMLEARAVLLTLLAFYVDLPDEKNLVGHRALAQFCKLLREQACADVSLEALAGEAGISPDHLRDLFRNRFGLAPVEYRTGLRMARARELLASTPLSVKEIAHRAGYPDPQYFSRVFKQHFSLSPREMIRRHRIPRL